MTMSDSGKCQICSRPLTPHQWYAGRVCGDWRCRERLLGHALVAHRQEAGRALGVMQVETYPVAVVPWRQMKLVPLADERRADLQRFVLDLLAQSCADESQSAQNGEDDRPERAADATPPDPATDSLLGAICAVCQGFCCFYGGVRHAFLDADAMAAYRGRHPGTGDAEVAAAYLAFLPERHCEGSCVYHTANGCALSRDMRARICNAYECRGLKDARKGHAAGGDSRACVVVRHDNSIVRSAFVDSTAIRRFPPGP